MITEKADASIRSGRDENPTRLTVKFFITAGPRTNDLADVRKSFLIDAAAACPLGGRLADECDACWLWSCFVPDG
jgi:hypothetical protein